MANADHKMTKSGQYWAFAHYSRHIKRGAKVFADQRHRARSAATGRSSHCGFVNPDGRHVLVVANRGPEQQMQIVLGSNAIVLELPADSVHTLEWA